MDKNEEFFIRKQLENKFMQSNKNNLDKFFTSVKDDFSSIVAYPIAILESTFKKMSNASIEMGYDAMELLITVNPLREATYWFIHEMLKRQNHINAQECQFDYEAEDFGSLYAKNMLMLHLEYKNGIQIALQRSVQKIKLNQVSNNTYEFIFPEIGDTYNKEMLYYYGLDDALQNERERNKVAKVDFYLFDKFNVEKLVMYPERIYKYIENIDLMIQNLDAQLYRLCKKRISIDVNKIAEQIESPVINNKSELINVLAFFYYLSRLNMHKFMFATYAPPYIRNSRFNYCYYEKKKLIKLAEQVGIDEITLNRYITYLSMDLKIEKGGFCEYPLLVFDNIIMWIPSSFILNDFQFSIVNGHYYKDIKFPKHEETIAQSIVNYITKSVEKYENIICSNNYKYNVPNIKYNNKDLQSDIDIALYDKEYNCLLIIECKWKDNVYAYTDDYVKIERAVNEVYKTQLYKHKYFLELDKHNYDNIFNKNTNIFENIDTMKVMYLFIDKRIQFHDAENERHVIPTFMFSYLLKKYALENKCDLVKVINNIKSKKTKVNYKKYTLINSFEIDGKIFI